jgi:hypothetical protein
LNKDKRWTKFIQRSSNCAILVCTFSILHIQCGMVVITCFIGFLQVLMKVCSI